MIFLSKIRRSKFGLALVSSLMIHLGAISILIGHPRKIRFGTTPVAVSLYHAEDSPEQPLREIAPTLPQTTRFVAHTTPAPNIDTASAPTLPTFDKTPLASTKYREEHNAVPPQETPAARQVEAVAGTYSEYHELLLAWLERHKRYPLAARRRKLTGVAIVSLDIARNGGLLASQVQTSSGSPVLDRAVEAMVQRADPFPPLPEDLPGSSFKVLVPVVFQLANRW